MIKTETIRTQQLPVAHILPHTPPTPFIGNAFLNNLATKLGFSRDRAEEAAISVLRLFREVFTNEDAKRLEAMLPATVSSPTARHKPMADLFSNEYPVSDGQLDLQIAMHYILNQFLKILGTVPSGRLKKDYTE